MLFLLLCGRPPSTFVSRSLELCRVLRDIVHEFGATGEAGANTEQDRNDGDGLPTETGCEVIDISLHVCGEAATKSDIILRFFLSLLVSRITSIPVINCDIFAPFLVLPICSVNFRLLLCDAVIVSFPHIG